VSSLTAPLRRLDIPAAAYLEVLERYLESQGVHKVSEAMHRSHMWVYHRLQELGISFRPRGRPHVRVSVEDCNHPAMLDELLTQLRAEVAGASLGEAA